MSMKRGFGVGAVVVIVALILIIGGYMYYSQNDAPVTPEDNTDQTGTVGAGAIVDVNLPVDAGTSTPVETPVDSTTGTN
jgi:hypothetical protein